MSTVKEAVNGKEYKGAIFSKDVKNRADDPYFVKKNEEAKIALSKIDFPETREEITVPDNTNIGGKYTAWQPPADWKPQQLR